MPIDIPIRGKDEASPALKTVSDRLRELQREIDALRAKGSVNLTVADAKNLQRLTSEAGKLERALGNVGQTGKQTTAQLNTGFGGLADVLGGLSVGGLGNLSSLLTGAGLAVAAGQIAGMTVEMAQLGAQSLDTERAFASVTRSIGASSSLLSDLQRAAGGTITELRLMQLTNTALAGASGEMGQAFANAIPKLIEGARAANALNPALGDTEFLFQSLVTGIKRGSPMLIDNTGITLQLGEANEAYARSLGKATAELTEEEKKIALLNATMAGVDRLVQQAGGSLDTMTSKTQRMRVATEELKTTLGELVAEPYTVVVEYVTRGVQNLNFALSPEGADERAYGEAFGAYQRAVEAVNRAQADLGSWYAKINPLARANYEVKLQEAQAAEEAALANLRLAQSLQDYNLNGAKSVGVSDDAADALSNLARVAAELPSELDRIDGALMTSISWLDEFKRAADQASLSAAAVSMQRDIGISFDYIGPTVLEANKYAAEQKIAQIRSAQEVAKEQQRLAQTTARQAAADYESEFRKVAGRIGGYLQQGMSSAKGLFDLSGSNLFSPGANGPFENIYRALDVAKQGQASPWAKVLGLTQEEARKISEDFQRGIFSTDVIGMIDQNALINEAQLASLAEQTQEAFSKAIASKAGVKVNLVSSMFGFSNDAQGAAGKGAENIAQTLTQVADVFGEQIKGADFAGRLRGYGETSWTYYGDGFVNAAKASTTLQAAIDGMVTTALARRAGTSTATGAARGAGVQ